MFNGATQLTLDPKGRFSMPTRHRDALAVACKGLLTVTKHQDGCLMIFPSPEWQTVSARIATWSNEALAWKRFYLGSATEVEMDGTGRVLISPELRTAAGISKDTMLLGMGNHFELWDKATYEAQEAQAMQGDMPDVFKEFSF